MRFRKQRRSGPGASFQYAGTLRYLRPGRGIPNAKVVRLRREHAAAAHAPSSIKTSQIDAVVKREEESRRHLRDSMPLHSRFPRSLLRAGNSSPPAAPSSSHPLSRIVPVQPPCVRSLPRSSLVQVLVQSNPRGVAFYNHVNLS